MTTVTRAPSNRISSSVLFVTVAAAPFPFGSTEPAAIAVWCIVLGLGTAVVSPWALRQEHFPLVVLVLIVILAYGFVLHEQLAARPWIASAHPLWAEAAEVLGTPIASSVSIARNQPFFSLGAPLANLLAVICSFLVCIDRNRARQLVLVIAWSGVAYAVYGLAAYVIAPTDILWREKLAYRDVLTSTFVNRNTAAIYFGSCAVLWLLIILQDLRRRLPPGRIHWPSVLRLILFEMPLPIAVGSTMLLVCLAAMLMTNSRAGVVLSLGALVAAFAIYFHRDLPRRRGIIVVLIIGGLIALLFLQILGGNVSGRFDIQGLSDEGRFDVYRSSLRMIADNPWFGTGLGTFAWNFPAFRSGNISMWGVWNRAHSTPLELATEIGLPLAGLIVLAWLIVLGVLIRGITTRRRDLIVPVAALVVAMLGLAHSLIDFSLQIPGYAIMVFALLGGGLAQSFQSIAPSRIPDHLDQNLITAQKK